MTKHEADVIGGLNMTDQISNEAYKQIMIAAQDENEVGDVLDKMKTEIKDWQTDIHDNEHDAESHDFVFERIYEIIDKCRAESEVNE